MEKITYSLSTKKVKSEMLAIYIRCQQHKRTYDVDTKIRVFNDEWDKETSFVKRDNPNFKKLNKIIRDKLHEIEGYELDYDGDFTIGMLMQIVTENDFSCDFYEFMSAQMYKRDIREGTIGIHKRILTHLKKYNAVCSITDITEDFVNGFVSYMKNKAKFAPETIKTFMSGFKVYYNLARKMFGNKVPPDAFSNYHKPKSEKLKFTIKHLSEQDIRVMENFIVRNDSKAQFINTIERFLFMSYTGTRISDMASLTKDNITIEDGKMWLTYTSVKTDIYVRVPLSSIFDGRAEQLINKHFNDLNKFFSVKNDCCYNSRLQSAIRHTGIEKHVTAHSARHTFASRLVDMEVPITTIQKLLGHSSPEMTMVYAKTNENAICRQLER